MPTKRNTGPKFIAIDNPIEFVVSANKKPAYTYKINLMSMFALSMVVCVFACLVCFVCFVLFATTAATTNTIYTHAER